MKVFVDAKAVLGRVRVSVRDNNGWSVATPGCPKSVLENCSVEGMVALAKAWSTRVTAVQCLMDRGGGGGDGGWRRFVGLPYGLGGRWSYLEIVRHIEC